MNSIVYNADCIAGMKQYPDNHFDLAVVDPPYGIDWMDQVKNKNKGHFWKQYENKGWDKSIPDQEYFDELFRVSKNQIVWGGNYMTNFLYPSPCWVIWDKKQEFSGAVFEMAWTSFGSPAKAFRMSRVEAYVGANKIHPTQKPIALYQWIYKTYLPDGGLVLDTHLGSGSNRISADKRGNIDFVGYEIDKDYFNAQEKRWRDYKSQLTILF